MRSRPTTCAERLHPVDHFIVTIQPKIVERVDIPQREARYECPPPAYCQGKIAAWLVEKLGAVDRMFLHQAKALEHLSRGENPVVATATASGKSMVFMTAALREIVEGNGVTLVFYPQKSLGADQLGRWQEDLEKLGYPRELVAEVNGDVADFNREPALKEARIILATPDVIHAWMMRMCHTDTVCQFLARLRYIVIDEAHVLEGVFGTQFALFFRRLRSAIRTQSPGTDEPQVIATTATLADPVAHMRALTGLRFALVGEDLNGSPSHEVSLLHIDGPDCGAPAERAAADVIGQLVETITSDIAAIAFADSRQGVERIVRRIDRADVLPYRGGYNLGDRRIIESKLRRGELEAVISTSACELGIDIPQFAYGLNVGVPQSCKSLRQRAGRVGRSQPGVFVVMAPRSAFAQTGSSLRQAITGKVEPSPLYLDNLLIQFQQACCYLRELGNEGGVPGLHPELEWPAGFSDALAMARPGATRPAILDNLAAAGLDNPHIAFTLRSMPKVTFRLKRASDDEELGKIDHEQALREAYPGGIYYHLRKPYRVLDWRVTTYEHTIKLQPLKSAEPTHPILNYQVNGSVEAGELIDHHYLRSNHGCIAETELRVVESVEGFRIGEARLYYSELRKSNPKLYRKAREFTTTGVLLRIGEPWFEGSDESPTANRRAIAKAFATILFREYGRAPGDIRAAHTQIAIHSMAGARKVEDAIAIFDTVPGGLRLTAPLFEDFRSVLERLECGANLAGEEALLSAVCVERLQAWYRDLQPPCSSTSDWQAPTGTALIFAPGSRVSIKVRGQLSERVLIEPLMMAMGDGEVIMYRYESDTGVQAFVAHDQVQPIGNDWRRALWNPAANSIEPLDLAA